MQALQAVFQAAKRGDYGEVEHLLISNGINANTVHHISGGSLICAVADTRTRDEATDRNLSRVLEVLIRLGWSMDDIRQPKGENALHLLACQPLRFQTAHRLRVFMNRVEHNRRFANMLAQTDWIGHLPEQKAPRGGECRQLRNHLRAARLAYANANQ